MLGTFVKTLLAVNVVRSDLAVQTSGGRVWARNIGRSQSWSRLGGHSRVSTSFKQAVKYARVELQGAQSVAVVVEWGRLRLSASRELISPCKQVVKYARVESQGAQSVAVAVWWDTPACQHRVNKRGCMRVSDYRVLNPSRSWLG